MSISWRVMLNDHYWNYNQFKDDFLKLPEGEKPLLAQSKGTRHMVLFPKKGDNVSFVIKGKVVMRGIVDSDGFQNGTDHQEDSYNIGESRLHAVPTEFVWIRITEVGLSEDIRRTGQATWAKMPV